MAVLSCACFSQVLLSQGSAQPLLPPPCHCPITLFPKYAQVDIWFALLLGVIYLR